MSGKTTAMVLAGAGLLVFLVILKQSIGSAADAPVRAEDGETADDDDEAASTASPSGTSAPANRSARIRGVAGAVASGAGGAGAGGAGSEPAAEPAPAVPFEKPFKPPPIVGKPDLHAQVAAVAPLVQACIDRTPGKKDGTASLSFVVAPKGTGTEYSAVVESSSYDDSGTTIQNEALVECLHQTATSMKFTPYAPDADAIVARRELVIEHGKLVSDRFLDYSYIRR